MSDGEPVRVASLSGCKGAMEAEAAWPSLPLPFELESERTAESMFPCCGHERFESLELRDETCRNLWDERGFKCSKCGHTNKPGLTLAIGSDGNVFSRQFRYCPNCRSEVVPS